MDGKIKDGIAPYCAFQLGLRNDKFLIWRIKFEKSVSTKPEGTEETTEKFESFLNLFRFWEIIKVSCKQIFLNRREQWNFVFSEEIQIIFEFPALTFFGIHNDFKTVRNAFNAITPSYKNLRLCSILKILFFRPSVLLQTQH